MDRSFSPFRRLTLVGAAALAAAVLVTTAMGGAPDVASAQQAEPKLCVIEGTKVAAPDTILLGQTAAVELAIRADCPEPQPIREADIVLVVDRSASMRGDPLEESKAAARAFLEMLDPAYQQVALVSFATDVIAEADLTTDIAYVNLALGWLTGYGRTNIAGALRGAGEILSLRGRPDTPHVIVLLSDGVQTVGGDPLAAAEEVRATGASIYAIGLGAVAPDVLAGIADQPDMFYHAPTGEELRQIYVEIAERIVESPAGDLVVEDLMAPDIVLLSGTSRPLAEEDFDRLIWRRDDMPPDWWRLSYDIKPTTTGRLPTNAWAKARYTDADGLQREYTFPVPYIQVRAPTATPAPTAVPTPIPTETPDRRCRALYLPMLHLRRCSLVHQPLDVVLVIDRSGSMRGDKLASARSAAVTFVSLLDPAQDRAALVSFSDWPRVDVDLTSDQRLLQEGIMRLRSDSDTNIAGGLVDARRVLFEPGPGNPGLPVVVLLTDGRHNTGRFGSVPFAAAQLRDAGATLFTIGLGDDADQALLRSIASPNGYYFAPTPQDLERIYRSIAEELVCP